MKGSEVKKILKSIGVSQAVVAREMGVMPQTLQSLLRTDDIKVGVLQEIAKAAGKNIFFFLDATDFVRIPKVNENDPELAKMIQTIHALVNYLTVFEK